MTEQAPKIEPGKGKLVYDKERRTIVAMTTVSEQDEDRAQKLTDSAMKMYFGPVDAWPNGLANWFYKAIATALADVRREEREHCAQIAAVWANTKPDSGPAAAVIAGGMREAATQIAEAIRLSGSTGTPLNDDLSAG